MKLLSSLFLLFSEFVDITQKASDIVEDIQEYELDKEYGTSSYQKILKPDYG